MKSRGCLIAGVVVGGLVAVVLVAVMWGVGVYNNLVKDDEGVRSAWGQVETQYQRRMDLIPNLVETVKGFAAQEKGVLVGVTEARAKVSQITVTKEVLEDPEAFAKFQRAQDGLGAALSRLLMVTENYPQLKSNENFMRLQDELAGTENRIAVERRKYNETVQTYNTAIGKFPSNFYAGMLGFKRVDEYFKIAPGAQNAPQVKFAR
jgi:LemA protein